MCGFVGFFGKPRSAEELQNLARQMSNQIQHRGPDDFGVWIDPERGAAMGHRRLSILDLSQEGHQPMTSPSGRFVCVYNGEIYNYLELQSELKYLGHEFKGHSDTEVLLNAFEKWGIETTLKRCLGMFAFALWDWKEQEIVLARDRAGEKPLYYGWINETFFFGSDLRSFSRHPEWNPQIDRNSLAQYFERQYVPAPQSIFLGISKLTPGSFVTIDPKKNGCEGNPIRYWNPSKDDLFRGSDEEAVRALDTLLRDAVKRQMISDVPLGAFLSGGIDSSTIVSLMQAESMRPVKTFTIGFNEKAYDEAAFAKKVSEVLHTEHTELYVSPQEALNIIPSLSQIYTEPFADASQIPTILVSRLARKSVTVSLSGDAGDELFAGYNRYCAHLIWQRMRWIPQPILKLIASGLSELGPLTSNRIEGLLSKVHSRHLLAARLGPKLEKFSRILTAKNTRELYHQLTCTWGSPSLVLGAHISGGPPHLKGRSDIESMMLWDFMTYLPDDVLTKVDRATMSASLESRAPFLDRRVIEFANRLPLHFKMRGGKTKWILRALLERYIPRNLIERPKMGFSVPISAWLRSELKDWASALLNEKAMQEAGFIDSKLVAKHWKEHLSEKFDHGEKLWTVLMFQQWLSTLKEGTGVSVEKDSAFPYLKIAHE